MSWGPKYARSDEPDDARVVTWGGKNDLQGTWKRGKRGKTSGAGFPFPPPALQVLSLFCELFLFERIVSRSRLYSYRWAASDWRPVFYTIGLVWVVVVVDGVSWDFWYVFSAICCTAQPLVPFFKTFLFFSVMFKIFHKQLLTLNIFRLIQQLIKLQETHKINLKIKHTFVNTYTLLDGFNSFPPH